MASALLYPLTFKPVLKEYVWGGRRLQQLYGRPLPDGIVAESWEIAAHEDGSSIVDAGHFEGHTLSEVHAQLGYDLVGSHAAWAQGRGRFPLLVKLLDATQSLSVQVHPDDDYAQEHERNELGKSEMWVVLWAEPSAHVILGVAAGTTPAKFREAVEDRDLERYLHRVPVQAGDFVCVPSGSLHAILAGVVIAEIQQNSNTTYRVYDWNRTWGGQRRPLHIYRALDVINFDQVEPRLGDPRLVYESEGLRRLQLCRNQYFVTERVELQAGAKFEGECNGKSLEIWGLIGGECLIAHLHLRSLRFALLPAALGKFSVQALTDSVLLRTFIEPD